MLQVTTIENGRGITGVQYFTLFLDCCFNCSCNNGSLLALRDYWWDEWITGVGGTIGDYSWNFCGMKLIELQGYFWYDSWQYM